MTVSNKIITHFNRSSVSYETVAGIQKKSALFLVQKLLEVSKGVVPKTILDLGSGTGYIPEYLVIHYPKSLYTLNDISPKMIEATQVKFGKQDNFKFCIGNMETIACEEYSLITSNFSLQWVDDLWETLRKFYQQSTIFAFSSLLEGTFHEWSSILQGTGHTAVMKKYPTEQALLIFFGQLGAQVLYFSTQEFKLTFKSAYCFIQYLKALGAGIGNRRLSFRAIKDLIADNSQELEITYQVFFVILKR